MTHGLRRRLFMTPRLTPTTFTTHGSRQRPQHGWLDSANGSSLRTPARFNDPRLMPTTFYDPWLTPTTPQRQNPSANGFSSRTPPPTLQTDDVPSRRVSYPPLPLND
ncbi:hypothetical protein B0H17DRAFT_1221415 [Mycena rosella]|uniref:Uncharacterized protein n=1 Tax=Mycena rosella TaxID=1033263 RepID=A0AAD7B455_MYCRO|nr:hypothetical protein B0H17DRAFT_1221415 [Mycena rosella]